MDITIPAPPTRVGQRVRAVGYGRNVTLDMSTGTVVRFTRTGVPVIATDPRPGVLGRTVSDPDGCFARIDADGRIIRTTA